MKSYLSPQRLAERWDVHVNTIRNLIKKGELEVVRVGKVVRIEETEAANYIQRTQLSASPPRRGRKRKAVAPVVVAVAPVATEAVPTAPEGE